MCAAALAVLAACGKKGPPLEPLRLVPGQPSDSTAKRVGQEVRLQFTLPIYNVTGTGTRLDLDRVEIYAVTVAPGTIIPPNRELLVKKFVIKTIPVRPLPAENEEEKEKPAAAPATPPVKDDRPGPGEVVTFTEQLTPAQLTPNITSKPLPPPKPDRLAAILWSGPPALPDPLVLTRIYMVRGVSRHGNPGAPSPRLSVPIVDLPQPPSDVKADVTETVLALEWTAPLPAVEPVAELQAIQTATTAATWLEQLQNVKPPPPPKTATNVPAAPATPFHSEVAPLRFIPGVMLPLSPPVVPRFNVYEILDGKVAETPLNPVPTPASRFALGDPEWERERCFVVRTVRRYGLASIEADAGPPVCVTPHDTFAPKAPTGLRAVASPGAMNLIWNANSEPDLAGYLVLRGTAPGDTLQPITPAPIAETTFKDTTVKAGVRYVYAIVAVDKAATPNTSPQSAKQEEVAR